MAVKLAVLAARGALLAATLATLAVPAGAYLYVRERVLVGVAAEPPTPAPLAADRRSEYGDYARSAAPRLVVLAYRDLVTEASPAQASTSVPVRAFAEQMRMLSVAGFHAVSAEQVAEYVETHKPLPPRPVLITFDARARAWSHADPVLARYGLRATVTVGSTVDLRRGRPPALSWPKLRAMVGTGRWSVGVGVPDADATVPVDGAGARGSAWLTHAYLPAQGRPETTIEFQRRIGSALATGRQAVVDEGLPSPALFSYPFQAGYPLDRAGAGAQEFVDVVDGLFRFGVLDSAPDQVATDAWVGKRMLPRLEVYRATTDAVLFARIREASGT